MVDAFFNTPITNKRSQPQSPPAENVEREREREEKERLCQSMWLFHLHSTLKIQLFSPFFPLAGATDKACCRLSLWSFKKKASTIFYNTAKRKKSVFSPYYEDETVIFHGSAKEKRPFPRPSPPKTQIRLTYPSYLQRISSLSRH